MREKPNKKNSNAVLQRQLSHSRFLLEVSQKLINIAPTEIDETVARCMQETAQRLNVQRIYIYRYDPQQKSLEYTLHYFEPNLKEKIPRHDKVDGDDFKWFLGPLENQQTVAVGSVNELPPEAASLRLIMDVEQTRALLACPMVQGGRFMGYLGFDDVKAEREWSALERELAENCALLFRSALQRRDSEKEAMRAEQKMRSLFLAVDAVVFISTPGGKLLDINPAGARLFGFASVQEALAIHDVTNFYERPADRERFRRKIEDQGHLKDYELFLRRKDGKRLIVQVTATAIRDANDRVVSYEGILRDITDRRHLEQQLFQAQKMESIGLMAGGIAHDFNNILTALIGYAQLSLMHSRPDQPHYPHIKNILNSGKKAENLIRQLLAFSRKQMVELKVLHLNTVIAEMHSMLSRMLPEDIHFALQLGEDAGFVKADSVQIQQVLANLVVNAGHAIDEQKTRHSPREITISTGKATLSENFVKKNPGSRVGSYVLLQVADSGIGMDEETVQKIFEPFFTTKKIKGGSGLGLSTVYGIVKQNQGYITVHSKPGKGTVFRIYWPLSSEHPAVTAARETELNMEQRSEHILFVEDDEDVRELACTGLRTLGYKVTEARHGQHALKLIERKNLISEIDILVTDMIMPEMGGEELAREVRTRNPKMKILLCSGYTDSRIFKMESEGDEGFAFLNKPYTIPKLEKKIRSVLDGS